MSSHIIVDGLSLPVRPGDTVLAACRREGVVIPALCHHPGLEPYGACRLCVVEVTTPGVGPETPGRVVASCTTPARGEMVVHTVSSRVMRVRRAVIASLLARHPTVEVLQELAHDLGTPAGSAPAAAGTGAASGSAVAGAAPPAVPLEDLPVSLRERCVLCGRCVRACAELGHFAIGFAGRGIARRVTAPFGVSSETCAACGACVEVCPTGAVEMVIARDLPDPDTGVAATRAHLAAWRTTVSLGSCRACGRPLWSSRMGRTAPEGMADLCPACRRKKALSRSHRLSG
ncbi:MAG: 2Fe-2S iron-sulfur cluster-binding protein [Bacillota bacterium]